MALRDQDGNEHSALKPEPQHPRAGREGGPPAEPVYPVSAEERLRRAVTPAFKAGEFEPLLSARTVMQSYGDSKSSPADDLDYNKSLWEITWGPGSKGLAPGLDERTIWECDIVSVPDTSLQSLKDFMNEKGAEGWEPFQILTAKSAGRPVHYVHLKREKR